LKEGGAKVLSGRGAEARLEEAREAEVRPGLKEAEVQSGLKKAEVPSGAKGAEAQSGEREAEARARRARAKVLPEVRGAQAEIARKMTAESERMPTSGNQLKWGAGRVNRKINEGTLALKEKSGVVGALAVAGTGARSSPGKCLRVKVTKVR
jgi:hypothetical protein